MSIPICRRCDTVPRFKRLKKQGADDIIVVAGGVIPKQDYDYLWEAGVKGIFGPGTKIPVSARSVLDAINKAQS